MTTKTKTYQAMSTPDNSPPLALRFADNVEAPAVDYLDNQNLIAWPLDPQEMLNFFIGSPWLTAIDNLLSDSIKSADFELVPSTEGGDMNDAEVKAASDWLNREDFGVDGVTELNIMDFIAAGGSSKLKVGNLFNEILMTRDGKSIGQLSRLLPQYTYYEIKKSPNKPVALELLHRSSFGGDVHLIPFGNRNGKADKHEYLHFREPNDYSSFYGVPDWYGAQASIQVDTEHDKYLKAFFANHTTPRYMITLEKMPSGVNGIMTYAADDKVEAWFKMVVDFFSANRGAMGGRNLVAEVPEGYALKAQPLDNKIDDPTFGNTSAETRRKILAVMHTSAISLGDTDSANRSNSEEQTDNMVASLLLPFAKPQLNLINKVLRHPKGFNLKTIKVKLKFDRTDQLLQRFKAITEATGRPILSATEGRALNGYPAQVDGELVIPANMIPVSDYGDQNV